LGRKGQGPHQPVGGDRGGRASASRRPVQRRNDAVAFGYAALQGMPRKAPQFTDVVHVVTLRLRTIQGTSDGEALKLGKFTGG
jgi:hypothetical protein